MKSVTVIHGNTTETVRLPQDGDKVTVHPALRSKLPLKRKVRDGKAKRKKRKEPNNNTTTGKTAKSSPRKKPKTKPASVDQQKKKPPNVAVTDILQKNTKKVLKGARSKTKSKKTIDYSAPADKEGDKGLLPGEVLHSTPETDPFGKVQSWLIKSEGCLPKSKSTPEGFAKKNQQSRAVIKDKSRSVGNLAGEKVRLQVVYKPPFKFSVRLRKPDKSCGGAQVVKKKAERKAPRTAVLIRTVSEDKKAPPVQNEGGNTLDNIDANSHTVQSDLEVLLQ